MPRVPCLYAWSLLRRCQGVGGFLPCIARRIWSGGLPFPLFCGKGLAGDAMGTVVFTLGSGSVIVATSAYVCAGGVSVWDAAFRTGCGAANLRRCLPLPGQLFEADAVVRPGTRVGSAMSRRSSNSRRLRDNCGD